MANIITTPRPPLNLFEVVRIGLSGDWQTVYEVPSYRIPSIGPTPERQIECAAIMTGLLISPQANLSTKVSVRVVDANGVNTWDLLTNAFVPSNDFLSVDLNRQVLKTGEKLQMRVTDNESAIVHFSFILNQREEFTVIS